MINRFSTIAILAAAGLIGCGTDEDSIALVRVTGLISKNGKPLADAGVVFTPAPGNTASTVGTDRTGPEGTYVLKFKGRGGVAPGKYKVVVTPALEMPAGAEEAESARNDPIAAHLRQIAKNDVKKVGARSKAPEVVKSEFEATVEPDKSQVLDFDVKASSSAKAATAKN